LEKKAMTEVKLPRADGRQELYKLAPPSVFPRAAKPGRVRVALSASAVFGAVKSAGSA